jgi:hypothetical protein
METNKNSLRGGDNYGIVSGLACVKDSAIVGDAIKELKRRAAEQMARKRTKRQPKYKSKRSARQAAALKKTLSTRKARARMIAAGTRSWKDPNRHKRASTAIKNSWEVKAVRKRRISGITQAWTPERLAAQSARMTKDMTDPKFAARRLAGIRKASADPEREALRIANIKKALAEPAVQRRLHKQRKQTLYTPEMNARRSARLRKMHADARAGLAALETIAKARNRGPGHPGKDAIYEKAAALHAKEVSWREIARQLDPDFDKKQPKRAAEQMRKGTKYYEKSKNLGLQ